MHANYSPLVEVWVANSQLRGVRGMELAAEMVLPSAAIKLSMCGRQFARSLRNEN